jgi:hypothetical protein
LKDKISLLEKELDDSTVERKTLRDTITLLEASDASVQEGIDEWKARYHLKADECMSLRKKLADHGAALRALGLTVGVHVYRSHSVTDQHTQMTTESQAPVQ